MAAGLTAVEGSKIVTADAGMATGAGVGSANPAAIRESSIAAACALRMESGIDLQSQFGPRSYSHAAAPRVRNILRSMYIT